jgi:hypothetical protein
MSNKKTLKMTKKNSKRGKSRKGGFMDWFKKKNEDGNEYATMDAKTLHELYQKDCKKHFGFIKNMSSKCRKINEEFQKKINEEKNIGPSDQEMYEQKEKSKEDVKKMIEEQKKQDDLNIERMNKRKDFSIAFAKDEENRRLYPNRYENTKITLPKDESVEVNQKELEERPTVIVTKPQINNYTPVNLYETDSETDDEDDELPPVNLVKRDPYRPYSSDEDDDEKISGIDYRTQQVLTGNKPAYGYGGKKRRTKKHFRKRSIGKRSIGKRSIGKRSIRNQKRRKSRKH